MYHITVDGVVTATFPDMGDALHFANCQTAGRVVLHGWQKNRIPWQWRIREEELPILLPLTPEEEKTIHFRPSR